MVVKKCNVCGKEFDLWDEQAGFRLCDTIGYGSKHDGEYIELDLCCKCFDEVMDKILPKCAINPFKKQGGD